MASYPYYRDDEPEYVDDEEEGHESDGNLGLNYYSYPSTDADEPDDEEQDQDHEEDYDDDLVFDGGYDEDGQNEEQEDGHDDDDVVFDDGYDGDDQNEDDVVVVVDGGDQNDDDDHEDEEANEMEMGGDEGEQIGEMGELGLESPNCPICFKPWTSDGPHRICCFPCGHVHGRSCLEKWLQRCGETNGKCPQCNRKFRQQEIINLYAPVIMIPNESLEESHDFHGKNQSLKLGNWVREISSQQSEGSTSDRSGVKRRECVRFSEMWESMTAMEVQMSRIADLEAQLIQSSDLQDEVTALRSEVAEIRSKMTEVEDLQSEVAELKSEMAENRNGMAEMERELAKMRSEMTEMWSIMNVLEDLQSEVTELRSEMTDMGSEMAEMRRMFSEMRRADMQVTKRRRPNNAGHGASGGVG